MNGSFFAVFIVVVVLALVAGVAVFGNDLLNPDTSAAKADAIRQVTQSKTDKEAIEWAQAQQKEAIEWDKAQQEAAFQQRQSDQTLEFEAQRNQAELAQMGQRDQIVNSWSPAIVAVILVATLVLSAALAYFLIRSGAARAQAPVKFKSRLWSQFSRQPGSRPWQRRSSRGTISTGAPNKFTKHARMRPRNDGWNWPDRPARGDGCEPDLLAGAVPLHGRSGRSSA